MSEDENNANRNNSENEPSTEIKLQLNLQIDEELLRSIFYFDNNAINCGEEHIARINTQQSSSNAQQVSESVKAKDGNKKALSITRSVKLKCWSMKKFEECKAKNETDSDFEGCAVKSESEDDDFVFNLSPVKKAPCAVQSTPKATTSKSQKGRTFKKKSKVSINENNAPCAVKSQPKATTSKSQNDANLKIKTEDSENNLFCSKKSESEDGSFVFELSPENNAPCAEMPISKETTFKSENIDNYEIKTEELIIEDYGPYEFKPEPVNDDYVFPLNASSENNPPCTVKPKPTETTSQNDVDVQRKAQDNINENIIPCEVKSEPEVKNVSLELNAEADEKISDEIGTTSKPQNCVKSGDNKKKLPCAVKSIPKATTSKIAKKPAQELQDENIAPNGQDQLKISKVHSIKTGIKRKQSEKQELATTANLPNKTKQKGKSLDNDNKGDESKTINSHCIKTGGKRKCPEDDTFGNEKIAKRICMFWKLGSLGSSTSAKNPNLLKMPPNQGSNIESETNNSSNMDISMNSSKDKSSSGMSNSPGLNKQDNEVVIGNCTNLDISMNSSKDKEISERNNISEQHKQDNEVDTDNENYGNMDISMNSSKDKEILGISHCLGLDGQDNQDQIENNGNMDISMNSSKDKEIPERSSSADLNEQGNETESEIFGYMDISMNSSKDQEIPDVNHCRINEQYNAAESISLYTVETDTTSHNEEITNIENSGNDNLNQNLLGEFDHENLIGFEVNHSNSSAELEPAMPTSMVEPDNINNEPEIIFDHVNVNDLLSEKSSLNSVPDPLGSVNSYVPSESDMSVINQPNANENQDALSEISNSVSDPIVSNNEFLPSESDMSVATHANVNENPELLSENSNNSASDPIMSNHEFIPSESDMSVVNHANANENPELLSQNSNSVADTVASNDSVMAVVNQEFGHEIPDRLSEMSTSNSTTDSQVSENEFVPIESDISVENNNDESSTGYEADDEARISRRRRELERRQFNRGSTPQRRTRRGPRPSNGRNLAIAERNFLNYFKQCNENQENNNDD